MESCKLLDAGQPCLAACFGYAAGNILPRRAWFGIGDGPNEHGFAAGSQSGMGPGQGIARPRPLGNGSASTGCGAGNRRRRMPAKCRLGLGVTTRCPPAGPGSRIICRATTRRSTLIRVGRTRNSAMSKAHGTNARSLSRRIGRGGGSPWRSSTLIPTRSCMWMDARQASSASRRVRWTSQGWFVRERRIF